MQLEGVEWDEAKNELNKQEHEGLSFEEAQYVLPIPKELNAWIKVREMLPEKSGGRHWA